MLKETVSRIYGIENFTKVSAEFRKDRKTVFENSIFIKRIKNFAVETVQLVFQPSSGSSSDERIIRPDNIAAEIYSAVGSPEDLFFRVEFQFQFRFDEIFDRILPAKKLFFGIVDQKKIIHIAEIMAAFQSVFDKLVQFIEINVGEKLTGKISDWKAFVFRVMEKRFVFRD
jgi:hypothetical protein